MATVLLLLSLFPNSFSFSSSNHSDFLLLPLHPPSMLRFTSKVFPGFYPPPPPLSPDSQFFTHQAHPLKSPLPLSHSPLLTVIHTNKAMVNVFAIRDHSGTDFWLWGPEPAAQHLLRISVRPITTPSALAFPAPEVNIVTRDLWV